MLNKYIPYERSYIFENIFYIKMDILYQDIYTLPDGKASAHIVGHPGSIPVSGISPGEGNGNSLQYSCLENFTDGGAW